MLAQPRRINSFLRIAGAFPAWTWLGYLAFAVYGTILLYTGGSARNSIFMTLLLLPIVAGTGLLSIAREGRLDLLFGTGISRSAVWHTAFVRSVVLPLLIVSSLAPLLLNDTAMAFGRVLTAGVITTCASFAVGILQPRYALGSIWLLARFTLLLVPDLRVLYAQLAHPEQMMAPPSWLSSVLGIAAFPELLITAWAPLSVVIVPVTLSLLAAVVSLITFCRADFGGHRAA